MNARDPLNQSHRQPLTNEAGEVRELTHEDLQRFQPAAKVLSPTLRRKIGVREQRKTLTKVALTLRLSPQVVEAFRATGDGWQTRINAALLQWLKRHKPEDAKG